MINAVVLQESHAAEQCGHACTPFPLSCMTAVLCSVPDAVTSNSWHIYEQHYTPNTNVPGNEGLRVRQQEVRLVRVRVSLPSQRLHDCPHATVLHERPEKCNAHGHFLFNLFGSIERLQDVAVRHSNSARKHLKA